MASKFLKNPNGGVYKDSNGRLIKVDLSLPTLSSPATAEDIASGKEAYGDDGVAMTGTAEKGYKYVYTSKTPSADTGTITISGVGGLPKRVIVGASRYPTSPYSLIYGTADNTDNANFFYGNYCQYNNGTGDWFAVSYDATTNEVTVSRTSSSIFKSGKSYDFCIIYQ